MNTNFWNKKRVLITGHTGFKGSWLSIWLKLLNANVVGFSADIPTEPSLYKLARVENGINSITGNIQDFEKVKTIIEEFNPEIVFHMAAQSLVIKSYQNPIETYSTNVMGTVNVFEAVREIEKPRIIINVTSDKCYENTGSKLGYNEEDSMGGHDPYSSSKGCAELITAAFRRSFFDPKIFEEHGISIASVRAGNVIGGGDWAENRLIPDIMRGIFSNRPVTIRNPQSVRPWQYVLDPLSGYLLLAERLDSDSQKFSGGWNFGPSENNIVSVSQILEKISDVWGEQVQISNESGTNFHEAEFLKLNCKKANSILGWKSKTNFEDTIRLTLEWYKKYQQKENLREICENQIIDYSNQ